MIPTQGLQSLPIEDFSVGQRTTGTFYSRTPSSPRCQNVISYVDKLLRKRPGYDTENIPQQGTSPVTGIYEYKLDSTTNFQFIHADESLSYMRNFDKNWTVLQSGLSVGATSEFETFQTGTQKYLMHCTHNNDTLKVWDGAASSMTVLATNGAPRPKYIKSWNNHLFAAGIVGHESRIQWSNLATYDQWQTLGVDNYDDNCQTGDGDYITGLGTLRGNLYVFKNYSIFQVTYLGGSPLIQVRQVSNGIGAVSSKSIVSAKITQTALDGTISKYEILIFLTPDRKVVAFDGLYTYTLSDTIYESNDYANIYMKSMNEGAMSEAHAIYYEAENLYILFFANTGSSIINTALCFNRVTKGVWPWTNMNFRCSGFWTGGGNVRIPYGGDYTGQTYRLLYGSHDTTTSTNWVSNYGFETWPSTSNLLTNGSFETWAGDIDYVTNGTFETWTGLTDLLTDGGMETWAAPWLRSNASIDDEDMADITDWTDGDAVNGVSSQATFDSKSCMKLDSGAAAAGTYAGRSQDIGSAGASTVYSMNLYFDAIGSIANNDYAQFYTVDGTHGLIVNFSTDGLRVFNSSSVGVLIGTNPVVQDVWQEWTFKVAWGASATVDIYLNGVLFASGVDCAHNDAATEGTTAFTQFGVTTSNRITYVDWFKAGADFTQPLTNWTSFGALVTVSQEATIKKAGTYSAKIARNGTNGGIYQDVASPTTYRNKKMVLSAWVYATAANQARLTVQDGVAGGSSAYHTGDSTWQFLSFVVTIDATASLLRLILGVDTTNGSVYYDSVKCYEQLAPTGWTLSGAGATVAREEGTIKTGTYSVKLTYGSAETALTQDSWTAMGGSTVPRGKLVTFGTWVYSTVASNAFVRLYDGTTTTESSNGATINAWTYISVTAVVGNAATYLNCLLVIKGAGIAYFDVTSLSDAGSVDDWTLTGVDALLEREGTIVKVDAYSAKITRVGNDTSLYQAISSVVTGDIITHGMWVWSSVADRARIGIVTDGAGTIYSTYHTGDSTWQYLTISTTIGGSPSYTRAVAEINDGDTTAYFDGASAYELATDWTYAGADASFTQVSATPAPYAGIYCIGLKRVGTNCYLQENYTDFIGNNVITYYQSQDVTLTAWVYASLPNTAAIQIIDSDGTTTSDYHPGDSVWRQLTATRTLGSSISDLSIRLLNDTSDGTVYFDNLYFFISGVTAQGAVVYYPIESFWETDLIDAKRPDVLKKGKYLTVYLKPRSNATITLSRASGWESTFREERNYVYSNSDPLGTFTLGGTGTPLGVDFGAPLHYDVPETQGQIRFRVYDNSTLESWVIHRIDFSEGPQGLGTTQTVGVTVT